MNIFNMLLSFIVTIIITYFNKDIFFTINFALIIVLYISVLNFLKTLPKIFGFEAIEKIDLIEKNKKLKTNILDAVKKNRELIRLYNMIRRECVISSLKNAHLTLLTASLTKNKETFDKTIQELESLGITIETINKYGSLINLVVLIESKKIDIIIQEGKDGNKLSFKEKSS